MQKQSLNREWRFYFGDPPREHWIKRDISSWRLLDLPHDWSIELPRSADNPSKASGGFFTMGLGWYIKSITPPEDWRGKRIFIEFEGVYMNSELWVNQDFIGRHPYGYTTFAYDLTPYLKIGEVNTIRMRVDNTHQLNSRWYSGSGIYRPVWLMVANPVHIAHWGVYITTPEVSEQSALVRVRTTLQNQGETACELTLHSRLSALDGAAAGTVASAVNLKAGESLEVMQEMHVAHPSLWSVDHPNLYRLESELVSGGKVLDTSTTTCGIRTISFDPQKGFQLNGKPMKLKGGCVHHDNGVMGSASYARSEERKVEVHKASGYNAIRTAHNPPSPSFLEACDRLGIMVIDEAFDCWRDGKNIGDYHVAFDDWWQRDIDSMVQRDRNHPCVILWSIGNELMERDGRSNGAAIARMLAERVHQVDPTRPVTAAICGTWDGTPWENTDAVFAALDVGGYNYLWKNYTSDHERHPERMMIGTETNPPEAFDHWTSVLQNNHVLGDFVWTSLDYLGESGIGRVHFESDTHNFLGEYPWHQANCGDIDLCGFKRPQSYYRDILWEHGHKLYIAVHDPIPEGKTPVITYWGWPEVWPNWNWAGYEGKNFKVDVYSACEKVELFLNGKSLGVRPTTSTEKLIASFEVPYEPGELKAIGYNGDEKMAECVVKTAATAEKVRLTPDRSVIQAEGGDLSFVTVEITDGSGYRHPAADRAVYFTIRGEGEIAAVGNANPISTESYRGSQRETYRGRCLVVVKSTGKPGQIVLRAQADGVDGDEVIIQAK